MTLDGSTALGLLPAGLRAELVDEFAKITRNYRENRWEATELDGGRFCEIVYTILRGHVNAGAYAQKASKPSRFADACKSLESADANSYSESVRLTIPRVLVALYDFRNRRGVGHVGGDVSANHMDAVFVLHATQWVMAELVRVFHSTDIVQATAVVDGLVDRTIPIVWRVGDLSRVLDPTMKLADQTLVLLYSSPPGSDERELAKNLDQDRLPNYRRVLDRLHVERLINYDKSTGRCVLSPKGVLHVEETLLQGL
jgi:hypothetical protein